MAEHFVGLIQNAGRTRESSSSVGRQRARLANRVAYAWARSRGISFCRVWETARTGIKSLLADHGFDHIAAERAEKMREQSPDGTCRKSISFR